MQDDEPSFQDRVKELITGWLEPEFSLKNLPPGPDVRWVLQAHDGSRHVTVCSLQRAGDHVLLEGAVGLSDTHIAKINAMSAPERHDWLYQLRLDLTAMGLDFGGIEKSAPKRIHVQQHVYVDGGLSKDSFMQRLHAIRHGVAFVQFTIQQRLGG